MIADKRRFKVQTKKVKIIWQNHGMDSVHRFHCTYFQEQIPHYYIKLCIILSLQTWFQTNISTDCSKVCQNY